MVHACAHIQQKQRFRQADARPASRGGSPLVGLEVQHLRYGGSEVGLQC